MRFARTQAWRLHTSTPRAAAWRRATQPRLNCVATAETAPSDADFPLERSEDRARVASADQPVTLSSLAEQIFSEGADSLIETTHKPLKINRDLALYRAKRYRQRGVVVAFTRKSKKRYARKAEAQYRKMLAMDPTDARAYVGLGKLMEQQKRYNEARKLYEDGCAVTAGTNAYLWTSRGNLERDLKNFDRAREFFDAAVNADRSIDAAWHAWGMMEKSLGNYKAARDCWRKGIRFAKDSPSPYLYQSLARLASDLKLYDQARYWYREGVGTAMGADCHVLWASWAMLEGKRGNVALMEKLYEKSLEVNPNGKYVYLKWGRFEQDRGFVDEARELFLKGHALNPEDPAFANALAKLESECGYLDRARDYYKKSIVLNRADQYSWQGWGVLEAQLGNHVEARKLFQRGVWVNPRSKSVPIIFQAWGRMEEQVGNVDVARSLYQYGLKADSKSEALWDAWIRLEEAQENFVKAKELRSDFMQNRVEFALPKDFSTLDESYSFVEEFFTQFSDWLTRRGSDSAK